MRNKTAHHSVTRDRQIIESVTEFAIVATDREGIVTDWNIGAEQILGWSAEEMIGETAERFFTPEDRAAGQIIREMNASLEYGRGIDERWHLKKDGTRFWASGELMPLRDDDGAHIGFVKVLRDRTDQRIAGNRLRETEERLRLASRATNDAIWDWTFATNHVIWNEALEVAYGYTPSMVEPTGNWWIEHIHPDDRQRIDTSIHAVIDGDTDDWIDEYRFLRADETYATVLDRGHVIREENGRAVRMLGAMLDLTQIRKAEADLQESRRLLTVERGLLQAIVQQAPVGISIGYADGTGQVNTRLAEMLGHGVQGDTDDRYLSYQAVHADGRPYAKEDYPTIRALRNGETLLDEPMRYRHAGTGEIRRWVISSKPVRDEEGNILAAVSLITDVEDQRKAAEHQTVLNQELAHRLKNTLAVVQSIATQTLRTAPDMATARDTLTKRIQILSRAHDILLTGQKDAGSVDAIIKAAISLHDPDKRIALQGPDLDIGPKAALTLALIMHELSTNAAKYGALSVREGKVHVAWIVEVDEVTKRPTLSLSWREIDGPPAVAPTRKGFGTRLIEMGLSGSTGGSVELDYASDGLKCRIIAPLTELQAND